MAWVFNPFTGKLDQTGSGGGNPFDQDLNTTDDVAFNSASFGGGTATIAADGQFSFQNGGYYSSTDGTGNFLTYKNNAYYQLQFVTSNGTSDPYWNIGAYHPNGSFQIASSAAGLAFVVYDGTQQAARASFFGGNASIYSSGAAAFTDLTVNGSSVALLTANTFTAGQTITAAANTSALTASYSVTGANTTPLLNLTGTWNTSGIARGIFLNFTDTASNAASQLLTLQTASTTRFQVRKDGIAYASNWITTPTGFRTSSGTDSTAQTMQLSSAGLGLNSTGTLNWASGSVASSGVDLIVARDAANTFAQRNGTNAQLFRLYGTFTDASNGRRLDITSTTGGIFTLTATGNGTGASGNLLKLTAPILLPASSVTLATNGDLAFEATSNTSLTIRYRGSDGTTRSASLTLA